MPDLHRPGNHIKELDGVVRGGPTMVMHRPADVRIAQALCALVETSDAPMHALYGLLSARKPEPFAKFEERMDQSYTDWQATSEPEPHDAIALNATLGFAHDLWKVQGPTEFNVALAVARPDGPKPTIEIDARKPMLVFHRGSLMATVLRKTLRVPAYAVMMMRGGVGASQRAERLVERTREKSAGHPGVEPLDRFDDLPKGAYEEKKGVIVFLHGLMSVDVGVFDTLLQQLRSDPAFADNCGLAGWPHDTLASIDTNAVQLRRLVEHVVGVNGPSVLFVCHSRGGLLGRSAAVKLCEKDKDWTTKLVGCVTFGTPHEGCPLAEAPDSLLGKVIAAQSWRNTHGFFSLIDALEYTYLSRNVRGIEDLRPATGGGTFIVELLEREATFAPKGQERALDVFAVGGATTQTGLVASLSNRALAGRENDLVVETRSSIPRLFRPKTAQTDCDHFSYFTAAESEKPHFKDVVDFIASKLRIPRELASGDYAAVEHVDVSRAKGPRRQ